MRVLILLLSLIIFNAYLYAQDNNQDNNNQDNQDNNQNNQDNNNGNNSQNDEEQNAQTDIDRLLDSLRQYRKDKENDDQYYGGGRIDKDW